jgi:hypothetical protein
MVDYQSRYRFLMLLEFFFPVRAKIFRIICLYFVVVQDDVYT